MSFCIFFYLQNFDNYNGIGIAHWIDWKEVAGTWMNICIQYMVLFVCLLWYIYDFNGQLQNWTTEHTSISAEKRFSTYWSTPIITPCRCSGIESEPTQKTSTWRSIPSAQLYTIHNQFAIEDEQRGVHRPVHLLHRKTLLVHFKSLFRNWRFLRLMKLSSKTLQIVPYLWNKKTQK